jgi:recombination DNA repair RAD52 pathway protein
MMERSPFTARRNYRGLVINIVGDFVIETQYDKEVAEEIEKFYAAHRSMDANNLRELEEIVSRPARTRLLITKNAVKARKLRKLFDRHFYLPSAKKSC